VGSNNDRTCVDYGTLTLLFQDNVGGLEVENPHTKHFQPAKPIVCPILYPSKCPNLTSHFGAWDYRREHG